jgi:hypothetical protein
LSTSTRVAIGSSVIGAHFGPASPGTAWPGRRESPGADQVRPGLPR